MDMFIHLERHIVGPIFDNIPLKEFCYPHSTHFLTINIENAIVQISRNVSVTSDV